MTTTQKTKTKTKTKPKKNGAVSVDIVPYQKAVGNLSKEEREHKDTLAELTEFEISSEDDKELAAGLLREVKDKLDDLEARRTSVTQPLNVVLRTVNGWFKPLTSKLQEAEKVLKIKIAGYVREQMEKQRVLAMKASESSTPEEAMALFEEMKKAPSPSMPSGMGTTKVWRWRVVDLTRVPIAFIGVNETMVSAFVRDQKGTGQDPAIDGLEFYQEDIVSVRR